jgi:Flp pilus assembly pilin Flp
MFRSKSINQSKRRRGAISTEYVIILVLIAVGGILAFMMLGQQAKEQLSTSVDKIGGKVVTSEKVGAVNTDVLSTDKTEMSQGEGGGQGEEVTVAPAP